MARTSVRLASALAAAVTLTVLAPAAHADPPLPPSEPPAAVAAPQTEYVSRLPERGAAYGPRVIKDYEEGEPVPQGYHPEQRTRTGLVVGGAVTLGVMWMISALVGAAINDVEHSDGGDFLYIPVLGPFLQMTRTDSSSGNMVLAIDGIAQGAGAAMLIGGIVAPRTVLVRNDLAEVRVTPMKVGRDGTGLGLTGTF
ncbi:MAG: hypothetical protein JWP97_2384 [Labilithrix sp.]|nr:hypothetical protein [Labilithrix sp.]